MKRTVIAVVIGVLLVLIFGGVVLWQYKQKDPANVAEGFLEQVAAQAFTDPEMPPGLEQGFAKFGEAFGLTEITITDMAPLSKEAKEAVFSFDLSYASRYFEPLLVNTELRLTRESIFDDWQVQWENNLPLPNYGLEAAYTRVRLDPKRGQILDTNGQVLAGAGSLVSVGVQPDRITDPDNLFSVLQAELGLSPEYVQRQYQAPGVQGHWFVPLTNLTGVEYERVDPILRPIPGVFFRRVDARSYPEGTTATHITGYLGEVTGDMLAAYPEREYLSGEIVGRAGLEQSQDDHLRGRPGYRFYVEETDGTRSLLTETQVREGGDITTTIDSRMQEVAHEVLGELKGALVVLDAETGAILALASTPSYDANEFVVGISSAAWQALSTDAALPMFNRAIQGLYPPGSVFKVVTVAAALDLGLYEPSSTFVDTGELGVQGNIVRNFQRQVFGEHNLHQAVVDSINTTVAQVGLELGASNLEQYFERLGLNSAHRIGLPMVRGQLGTPSRSRVALTWSAIGQDQVLLTPLHIAQIFSIFANQGNLPPIHLIKGMGEPPASAVLKPETVAQINGMLQDVVLQGTGQAVRNTSTPVYGKTGTAEIVGRGNHAWFAGHTELSSGQRLAFALLLEEGGIGGQAAAPLMGEYLNRLPQ